jgi:hypothetical protein
LFSLTSGAMVYSAIVYAAKTAYEALWAVVVIAIGIVFASSIGCRGDASTAKPRPAIAILGAKRSATTGGGFGLGKSCRLYRLYAECRRRCVRRR